MGQVDVILLNFSKAFDKVPHEHLLHKLSYYGIRNDTLRWIRSFLSDRKQGVVLEGTHSSQTDVTSGVPLGTVLGPLLFLTFINNLPEVVSSSHTQLFADDRLLFRKITCTRDQQTLKDDLTSLERRKLTWQIDFYPASKSTVIWIMPNKK